MSTRRPARLLVAACAAALAIALTGCGTGADRTQVRAVTTRFFSALDAQQRHDACAQLTPSLRKSIEQEHSAAQCTGAVAKLTVRGSAVRLVRVYATSARVGLASGESVFLSAMRDGWRIDALGCQPRSHGPYDCQEQG
jgi:hypothetical protein